MKPNCKKYSSQCRTPDETLQRGISIEGVKSKGLLKIHEQGAFSDKNIVSVCVDDQNFPFADSQHGVEKKPFITCTKESQASPQNICHGVNEKTMELLQSILRRELKNDVGMYSLTPKAHAELLLHTNADQTLELENVQVAAERFGLPPSHATYSSASPVASSSQRKSTHKSKRKETVQSDRNLSIKGQQLDLNDFTEKLQQKELHTIVQLLHMKNQELRDVKQMSKLREMDAHLLSEKLTHEEDKISEVKRYYVCEDMRQKLCIAKSKNESFARQLKALLEKYKRLKKRASALKEQLLEERTKRKTFQKTLTKTQQIAEELLTNQTLLEEQRDTTTKQLSACKMKIAMMEKDHKNYARIIQKVENDGSTMKGEFGKLQNLLRKAQEENKQLAQAIQSKVVEKERTEKKAQESLKLVKQLYAELQNSKKQRQSINQQLEAMQKDLQLVHNRHNAEILQLQEHKKTYMEQLEGMTARCEALNEVVSKLKRDKHVLKEKLECLQKEKAKSEAASKQEEERLKDDVSLLQKERKLLLDEMGDLRKDYFSLSDRITQRLGQMEEADLPMCIVDISSVHHKRAALTDNIYQSHSTPI